MPLLEVNGLRTFFHTRDGIHRAVDGVSFALERGATLGIVGESGSGKSVTCYSLMGLVPQPPGRIEGGSAMFDGIDLLHCPPRTARSIRGKRIAMIFQDPMTSLNPYLRIGDQLIEPLLIHEKISKAARPRRGREMLEAVGIHDAAVRMDRYPHEFSGGMRQRVMIAMALITRPELLIADEPTTALDVTVQAQILELIRRFQRELGMAVIFITHDLAVVSGLCDRVLVMYAGRDRRSRGRARDLPAAAPSRTRGRCSARSRPRSPKGRSCPRSPGFRPISHGPSPDARSPRGASPPSTAAASRIRRCANVAPSHASACLRAQAGEI